MRTAVTRLSLSLSLLAAAPAAAQVDVLLEAEQAYLDVDFARTLTLAEQALRAGTYSPSELARIHRLIGIAASAQGDEARAREAYTRMLALEPDVQLDENLSPRLRQPFMEARGQWSARNARFELLARRLRDARGLELTLSDPFRIAERVIVSTRPAGRATFDETPLPARGPLVVSVTDLGRDDALEYYVLVLDEHGNRLIEHGSEVEPHSLAGEAPEPASVVDTAVEPTAPSSASSGATPWLTAGGAALTLISGGILAWSIADVLGSHADYLAAPTLEKYYSGLDLQTRTNVLITTTAVLGAATAVLAIFFTDWSGGAGSAEAAARPRFQLFASPDYVGAALGGRF